jgi:ketosteroid isomerase-like protein
MARGKVEVVQLAIDAFNRRDLDALADLGTPDFEFAPYLGTLLEGNVYRGPDAFRSYFEDADSAWQDIQVSLEDAREVGDRVLLSGELRGRGRASGLDVRVALAWVADFHEGRVARLHSYQDMAAAEAAAGLS